MSNQTHHVIRGQDPTKIRLKVKETIDGAEVTDPLLIGDTITAIIYKDGAAISAEYTLTLTEPGTSLSDRIIIPQWTKADSLTWAIGRATIWITKNGEFWFDDNLKIVKGPE